MLRRRQRRSVYLLGSLLLLAPSLHAPTAYSAPGDPPSGSPAGAVYELPLQGGRADAAPKLSGGEGSGTGSAGQGEAASLYRTENNFGSSSQVPGLAAAGTGAADGAAGGAAANAGDGSGSAGGIAAGAIAGTADGAPVADAGNTSVTAGIVLLAAIGLLAAGAGVLSRRFSG